VTSSSGEEVVKAKYSRMVISPEEIVQPIHFFLGRKLPRRKDLKNCLERNNIKHKG
jgi:hypothetical protein